MTLTDGTELSPALGIGAFAEKTLVAAGQATKVNPAARPEAAGLLGCGVMAGLGAAMFTGDVGRATPWRCSAAAASATPPSRVAARRGPHHHRRRPRPAQARVARTFGATHTVDARTIDPVEAIRALTDGNGADVCIEAVGRPEVMEQAFYARDLAGTLVQVGVPTPDMNDRAADDRVLRPRRGAEAELVRRLPPVTRLPVLIDLYL